MNGQLRLKTGLHFNSKIMLQIRLTLIINIIYIFDFGFTALALNLFISNSFQAKNILKFEEIMVGNSAIYGKNSRPRFSNDES